MRRRRDINKFSQRLSSPAIWLLCRYWLIICIWSRTGYVFAHDKLNLVQILDTLMHVDWTTVEPQGAQIGYLHVVVDYVALVVFLYTVLACIHSVCQEKPWHSCTDGHIGEPFTDAAHLPRGFRALELSYNCSFYMCLFKWHDRVHSCSAWQGLFKRLWAVNTHAGVFRPPQSISDDSVSGSVVGTAALYLCILCFGWVSYLASVHLTSPMGTCPAT